jgi:hypothetical protein
VPWARLSIASTASRRLNAQVRTIAVLTPPTKTSQAGPQVDVLATATHLTLDVVVVVVGGVKWEGAW